MGSIWATCPTAWSQALRLQSFTSTKLKHLKNRMHGGLLPDVHGQEGTGKGQQLTGGWR